MQHLRLNDADPSMSFVSLFLTPLKASNCEGDCPSPILDLFVFSFCWLARLHWLWSQHWAPKAKKMLQAIARTHLQVGRGAVFILFYVFDSVKHLLCGILRSQFRLKVGPVD